MKKTRLTTPRRLTMTLMLLMLTAMTAWADAWTDKGGTGGSGTTSDPYYVNMPTTGTTTLDLSDGTFTTFKVYDDGGKYIDEDHPGNYSDNCNGYLVITAPTDYAIRLAGSINSELDYDYLYVYEVSDTDNPDEQKLQVSGNQNFDVKCTSGSMIIKFTSDYSNNDTGLDFTVTISPKPAYAVSIADVAGGTVAASVGGTDVTEAKEDEEVTLTAEPGDGYLLCDLIVTDADSHRVTVEWTPWTNTATFTMPASAVTVTPTFTNAKSAAEGLFVNIPATDSRTLTIPEGVTSFKIYDDGGATGDYSPNCNGSIVINIPEGYRLQLTGSVTTDGTSGLTGDLLRIYEGNNERFRETSTTAGTPIDIHSAETSNTITLNFLSNASDCYAGLDLTATLVGNEYAVTVVNPDGMGGSVVTASVGGESVTKATGESTVTLTASPAEGYVLGALSVKDADGNIVYVSDMLWYTGANTATFTMPRSNVTVTPVFTNVMTAEGGLTVNMPSGMEVKLPHESIEDYQKSVTIPSGVTSFKLYDYGGSDGNYSDHYKGVLYLTAPAGCVLQLSGSITTQSGDTDVLSAYDGTDAGESDFLLNHVSSTSDGVATAIPTVVSTGQTIQIDFSTDDSDNYAGLDLTVTVISPGTDYSVSVATAEGGTMEASTTTAQLGDVVTLTATPASGCVLSGLSVTSGGQPVKTNWNVWTNSATFKMPNGDVSVTPTFTSDLTSFSINMPVTGHKDATIPEGVASFKIYDDGGPNGNFTPYCRGQLNMTAPEGCLLRFTGSVAGPDDKFLLRVDGNDVRISRNDIDVTSTDNNSGIYFGYTDDSANGAGLDLTATVLYGVNVAAGIAGGTVTPDKAHAAAGETVTLTVTPNAGYAISTVSINGQPLEAVAGVYAFTMTTSQVDVSATFRKLMTHTDITVDIPAQKYDGTALTPAVTITDANGGSAKTLTQDEDYSLSYETCLDAGDYTVTITGIGAYDGTTTKTFTVTRRAVTLTSGSDTKTYDGTALTNNNVSVSGDGFAESEGAIYDVTGSQTDAGSSANAFTYALNESTMAANYDIQKTEGTLTVTKLAGITVTITGHTSTVTYDGEEHTVSGYAFASSSPLYTESDFTFSGTDEASRTDAGTTNMGLDEGQFSNTNANFDGVTFAVTDGYVTVRYYAASLADNADNTDAISEILTWYGGKADVKLKDRTLWKDGAWNTLCLPFDVTIAGSVLDGTGVEARTLTEASIEGTTLNLTFGDAVTTLSAGVPYIIKWTEDNEHPTIDNPVFSGVTINATDNSFDNGVSGDDRVRFLGTYKSTTFTDEDKSILFLGAENALFYPQPDLTTDPNNPKYPTIGAQRAYFKIGEDDTPQLARALTAFNIDFGDETTKISSPAEIAEMAESDGAWYDLSGRKLDTKPTKKGVYVRNGKKVVIK